MFDDKCEQAVSSPAWDKTIDDGQHQYIVHNSQINVLPQEFKVAAHAKSFMRESPRMCLGSHYFMREMSSSAVAGKL